MMAQNTSEDKEISELDAHETKKSSESVELISFGACNHCLESYVHKRLKDLSLEDPPSHEKDYTEFLCKRGEIYEEALGRARPLNDTTSEAEREVNVQRIEDFVVWNMVNVDFHRYRQGQPACGRIECWAASQKFVNIVVALIRPRGADDQKSVNEGRQPTPISKGLLALAIAAENNDLKMVEALKHIAVADESFGSSEPDLPSPHKDLFCSDSTQPLYTLYPLHEVWLCPIEAAARLGLVEMVTKLIALPKAKIEPSQRVMKCELMTNEKSKWRRAFDWAVRMGRYEVVELLIDKDYIVDLNKVSDVRGLLNDADVKSYGSHQSPLALAVLSGHCEVVNRLCETKKGGLNAVARNSKGITVLQMAYEKKGQINTDCSSAQKTDTRGRILNILMERPEINKEVKRLTEERKVHVDAINAILVGTAVIATATFAGWLSPPLGYSSPPGMDGPFASVEGHPILEKFWVFNSLSFFFSIATFMVGANVALPPGEDIYIGDVVQSLRWKLTLAYFLVSAAVFFVIGAFACAGFAVLPPISKYTVNMALTVGIGVTVVAVVVFTTFFGHMFTKSGRQQLKHQMKESLVYKVWLATTQTQNEEVTSSQSLVDNSSNTK
jgi:hypothetical protein